MSKGKYASKHSRSSKSLVLVLALVTLITATVGGTLAWLYDTTEKVENTFTVGDINIQLTESEATNGKKEYSFVPGQTLKKDPKVTVDANSENCYLFIKIKETNNTCTGLNGKIINWTVRGQDTNPVNTDPAQNWVKYDNASAGDGESYYYRKVTKSTDSQEFPILVDNEVKVNYEVTKKMVEDKIASAKPTLSFWAAAIQSEHLTTNSESFAFSQITWPE